MNDVTRILNAIEQGDSHASDELLPLVYEALRRLAAEKMAQESPGQTLQATALVHEVYLRLVDTEKAQQWDSRGHFFAAAAEAMRRILVEKARSKGSVKHGGGRIRLNLDAASSLAYETAGEDLLLVDDALTRLAKESPARAELVKLRFFAGLTMSEAATALGVSLTTAERHWTYARTWLYTELCDSDRAQRSPEKSAYSGEGGEAEFSH
jgi:RNA polymerase sigma factor (TIGR02999 family)